MSDDTGRLIISRDTLIPLGTAVAVVVGLITGAWWLAGLKGDIERSNNALRDEIRDLRYRIERSEQTMLDRWTATHQRLWASEMQRRNPTLTVPEVSDIIK